ncbi:hypothetical protein ZHAS_00019071 [Anopheles sinensis]|uniref:Uncharacterized protein n=1 Tax=Anopheles sinensis TaxID=74873 RepID=A0A084WLC8_ANOSI|nr:hypothetical protein ZHAS_00019071 [Anopheles sinensis]
MSATQAIPKEIASPSLAQPTGSLLYSLQQAPPGLGCGVFKAVVRKWRCSVDGQDVRGPLSSALVIIDVINVLTLPGCRTAVTGRRNRAPQAIRKDTLLTRRKNTKRRASRRNAS